MKNKSGITMTMLIISIAIMVLLMTSSVIIGTGYITDAKYDDFKTMVSEVSNSVNAYLLENGTLPFTSSNQSILYNNYSSDFAKEVEEKGDAKNKLYIVDIAKLGNFTIKNGKGEKGATDIFVVAENTNNVYYLKGYKYKGKMYYGV